MIRIFAVFFLLETTAFGAADRLCRQEVEDLKRRIRHLEETVERLQKRVGEESTKGWICTISAMGEDYSSAAASRAVAKVRVLEKCKKKSGNSFFCRNAACTEG